MIRMIVDLPAPLGPIRPATVPRAKSSETSESVKCRYLLEMWEIEIADPVFVLNATPVSEIMDDLVALLNGLCQPFLQLGAGQTQQQRQVGCAGQMSLEFVDLDARLQIGAIGHDRTLSLPGRNHSVAFEFEVRALDCDDADLQLGRELPNRGQLCPRRQISHSHPPLNLLDDLQIQRPWIGLRNHNPTVISHIHSIYRITAGSSGSSGIFGICLRPEFAFDSSTAPSTRLCSPLSNSIPLPASGPHSGELVSALPRSNPRGAPLRPGRAIPSAGRVRHCFAIMAQPPRGMRVLSPLRGSTGVT